jgi:CRISPR-associated protein Csm1
MDKHRLEAALAGLLHDIGKIEQRARVDPWNPAPGIEASVGPVHATWTAYFCQTYMPKCFQGAALAGAYHHYPDSSPAQEKGLSKIIALADKLSAGERSDQAKDYPKKQSPQQMISIFDQVSLNGEPRQKDYHYLPLAELSLKDEVIFPGEAEPAQIQAEAYEKLREVIEKGIRLDPGDDETYLENVLAILQRTAWCVPSAYYHSLPDVSLYDHSRMTAALAVCLTEKSEEDVDILLEAVIRDFRRDPKENVPDQDHKILDTPIALLLGGDISGIQQFIYTLSSKGAARTLRGRSFYLQLLTEAVLRYLLRELDLPATNVIYSGGGHFYLLAPLSAERKLEEIQNYVTQTLLSHHGTSLYLALGYAQVPASGFRKGNFPIYWEQMHAQLVIAKQHRYTELGERLYEQVFKPKPHGGNRENTCAVCGEEREKTTQMEDDPAARKCSFCASFEDPIGKRLPHSGFVGIGLGSTHPKQGETAQDVLGAFGVEIGWAKNANDLIQFDNKVERAVVWALSDTEKWPQVAGVPSANLLHYTVNKVPPMAFDELQKKAKGIPRLGVLRMDLDDLGMIFNTGFGPEGNSRATLARLSTLSFQMSLFFEGWIEKICEDYPDLIYAVYAGGDDVFLIGPWDIMPELGMKIASALSNYTGHNSDIHISGGLAFIHGKYPVYQAAEDAGVAEEQAKDLDGKNAFSFLGQAWKWEDFSEIHAKFIHIKEIVTPEEEGGLGGPQALIQRLRQFATDEAATRKKAGGKMVYGRWMWLGVYYLTRMEELALKKRPQVSDAIKKIRSSLDKNDFRNFAQWGTAARWAQLELRKQNGNKDN